MPMGPEQRVSWCHGLEWGAWWVSKGEVALTWRPCTACGQHVPQLHGAQASCWAEGLRERQPLL